MAIMDVFKSTHRDVSGVIERIGVVQEGDASYVLRLKGDAKHYRVYGFDISNSDQLFALALTAPGDQVRFQCTGDNNRIKWKSFENLTYK